MARVAGEVADGVPYVRVTDKYMREVLLPNVKIGLERARRNWNDVEISECGFTVLGENEQAIEQARRTYRYGDRLNRPLNGAPEPAFLPPPALSSHRGPHGPRLM